MAIVYKITNTVNGKMYIGATEKTIEERWRRHVKSAIIYKRDWILSKAIRKYGPDAFIREVLEEHPDRKYTFDVLEPKYILEHNTFGDNGYNMTGGSEGGIGHKHTEETKQKIRESVTKAETREKIRSSRLGKKHTPETIEKLRLAGLKRTHTEETKEKMRKITHTEETKEKLRQANIGKKHSLASKEKVRQANIGKKLSPETKEKIRQSLLRRSKI